MNNRRLAVMLAIASVSAASLACSISIPGFSVRPNFVPEFGTIEAGELQREEILVEPQEGIVDLDIGFGGGELTIRPDGENLVSGEAAYNVEELAPVLNESGSRVSLTTGELQLESIPTGVEGKLRNEWSLALGAYPMHLDLDIGAADADLDLGGLSLHSLTVDAGAADLTIDFSSPTTAEMDRFDMECGASSLRLQHLGNLNTRRITFNGAAGDFDLDFTGGIEAERDLYVELSMAAGQLTITVPEDAAVSVNVDGAAVDVDTHGSWSRSGNAYTQEGESGSITFDINAGAGQVELYSE